MPLKENKYSMENSQFRKHLKYSFAHHLRAFYIKKIIGYCGKRLFIEKNVKFLRFPKNIQILNNVAIKEGTRICACNEEALIKIGNNTTIGYHNFIFSSEKITIGNDCLIAPFVYIVDSNHQIKKDIKINNQTNETAPIIIEDDVWLASNVTILKGVKIGHGAVIAANSVVNTDVEPYTIYGGSPAKKIGIRE